MKHYGIMELYNRYRIELGWGGCLAIESGRFFLPKNTAFLDDFVDEMVCFPAVKHDDQVDTVSQYFNWLTKSGVNPKIRFI